MNIYVGNISFSATEDDIRAVFEQFGTVDTVKIIIDRETGRSKGFGFVEMPDNDNGQEAIDNLNGMELDGRALKVNEARPRNNDRGGYGGGGYRGGGGGGYRGGGGGGYRNDY